MRWRSKGEGGDPEGTGGQLKTGLHLLQQGSLDPLLAGHPCSVAEAAP